MVEAFLLAGASDTGNGCVYNLGGTAPISLYDLACTIIELAGHGDVRLVPWPEERKKIDIGDVYSSYARIENDLGWRPTVPLRDGLSRTLAYYREHLAKYL